MGYDYRKRLSKLKKFNEEARQGRFGFLRAFFACFIVLAILASLVSERPAEDVAAAHSVRENTKPAASDNKSKSEIQDLVRRLRGERQDVIASASSKAQASWQQELEGTVKERLDWIDSSTVSASSREQYLAFSQFVVNMLFTKDLRSRVSNPDGFFFNLKLRLARGIMRIGFILLAFWHVWLVAMALGFFVIWRKLTRTTRTPGDDLLAVCDRKQGPFYSGIYGPWVPNHSTSGTDISVPGLASPSMASKQHALTHPLAKILNRFGALNDTSLSLVRVILAYGKYPGYVEEERAAEEVSDKPDSIPKDDAHSIGGLINRVDETVEKSACLGLQAVCEAYRAAKEVKRVVDGLADATNDDDYFKTFRAAIDERSKRLTPRGALLLSMLTPEGLLALAAEPILVPVIAYLATEAGKALVFEEVPGGFSQISRFPNLQARAVLHSFASYHREFDGKERMCMRQAILCSRRHGDFGRVPLPVSMPDSSRALRNWLEVLYAKDDDRCAVAQLVELDSHLEMIYRLFKVEIVKRISASTENGQSMPQASSFEVRKGLPYKSVLLLPLNSLVTVALGTTSIARQAHVSELMELTRQRQARFSISARLPGFKRQAMEAAKGGLESGGVTQLLAESGEDEQLIKKWLILRRMLTRYNWLSTRIGDDSVPVDGLVQAIVELDGSELKPQLVGLDALVPLRVKRLVELFGNHWERENYGDAPEQKQIEVFVETPDFQGVLRERLKGIAARKAKSTDEVVTSSEVTIH